MPGKTFDGQPTPAKPTDTYTYTLCTIESQARGKWPMEVGAEYLSGKRSNVPGSKHQDQSHHLMAFVDILHKAFIKAVQ